jgi:YD repeat-containing protein
VTDPLNRVTGLTYDPAGNPATVTVPKGNQSSFTYWADNLLKTVDSSGDPTVSTFTYNPTHTLASVETSTGLAWNFAYDNANRLTQEQDQNNPGAGTFTIARAYDPVSNLTGLTIGALAPIAYTYNERNELLSLTGPGGETSFGYDFAGNRTLVQNPSGRTRTYTYDPADRVQSVTNLTGSGSQGFSYSYDPNGNVLSENTTTYTPTSSIAYRRGMTRLGDGMRGPASPGVP